MSFNHFLHENILLPISDILSHQQVSRYLNAVELSESWPDDRMRAFQEDMFHKLVRYSADKVPFYRDWFRDQGLVPDGVSLQDLPVVSKSLMRQEGSGRFAAEDFPKKQRLTMRSSGSTGEPFTYYESKLSYSVNLAAKLRTWYQAGYRLGDCYMKIASRIRNGKWKQIQDKMNNCIFVPFYYVEEGMLKTVLDTIEKKKPCFIRSYPAPLYLLAKYRLSHPEYVFVPHCIFTTGATLYETYRETIERAFACNVIDSYSCEGTPNVYETLVHYGYRVTDYYGIIEVLDQQNQPVTDGIGRVVSTNFWNYAQPFLRYDTQDLVEVRSGEIVNIIGRSSDIFTCANGKVLTVHNITYYFYEEISSIDAFQVVNHNNKSVTFRLVVNAQFNTDVERQIVDFWQLQMGMPVDIELVDAIPLMNNNKHLTIVNE